MHSSMKASDDEMTVYSESQCFRKQVTWVISSRNAFVMHSTE